MTPREAVSILRDHARILGGEKFNSTASEYRAIADMIEEAMCKPAHVKRVACGHCHGTGHIELTGIYADTLELLKKQKTFVTGAELARIAGVKNEAMCNRLRALERHGFAVSKPYGKARLWKEAAHA